MTANTDDSDESFYTSETSNGMIVTWQHFTNQDISVVVPHFVVLLNLTLQIKVKRVIIITDKLLFRVDFLFYTHTLKHDN